MSALSVSLRSDLHAAAPAECSSADLAAETRGIERRIRASVTGDDLTNELFDYGDALLTLARTGEHEAIGRLVCTLLDAYVARLVDREYASEVVA